tara:strand:- start:459 stop:947 length:489 start_codon:yes stop_codon:yes gene_type:complete
MKPEIVKASKDDLEFILLLNQNSMPAVSSSNIEMMQHFLKICHYFKILKINSQIVGFLNAILPGEDYQSEHYKWFIDKYDSFIYVDRIVLDKTNKNQGYGTLFYNDLINSVKSKKLDIACEINTKPYNKQSIQFHKKYGFSELGRKDINIKKSVMYMIYQNK